MYASLRGRLRQAGLFLVLLAIIFVSNPGGRTKAQDAGMRWDGLIELISGRYNYPPPTMDPPVAADGASAMSRRAISADGRYILFNSDATNLGASSPALYVRDRRTSETRTLLAGPALNGTLSADGNHVAFEVCDPMGQAYPRPDWAPICDVYALDLRIWSWTLISALPDNTHGDDHSGLPVLSSDGRFVVFRTKAANLSGGTAGVPQLVLRDRDADGNGIFDEPGTALLETVSTGVFGQAGNQESDTAEVSDDGRFIAFRSRANNLVAGDQNNAWDVFLRDRQAQQTQRINLRSGIEESPIPVDSQISMTPDGRYIAYASADPMLAPAQYDDTNGVLDVFVYDASTGSTTRVDVGWGPPIALGLVPGNGATSWPTLSADGRYVSLQSAASNAQSPGPSGSIHTYVVDRALQTVTRVSLRPDGVDPDRDAARPGISADGSLVTFISQATNLSPQAWTEVDRVYAAVHLQISPSEVVVPGSGGTATFMVTTQQHTQWWLDWTEWVSWWQLDAPPFSVGNGEIRFRIDEPNPNATPRSYVARVHSKSALLTQLEGMSLTSLSPNFGPASGGTEVTLRGTGFEPGVRVSFAGEEVPAQFVDSTTIVVTTPPHAPETVWVATFSSDYRQNAWIDAAFRYTDISPPQIHAFANGEQGADGWFKSDVSVGFWWWDPEAPVTSTSGCDSIVVSSDTPGTTFTCTATSEGGTTASSITVKRDTLGPSIAVTSPAAGRLYELGSTAVSAFTCSDTLSGVQQCGGPEPSGSPIDTSTSGWRTFSTYASDVAGNLGVKQAEYAVSTDVCVAGIPNMVAWWRMEANTLNTRSNSTSPAVRVGLPADVFVDAITGQGYQFAGTNGYLNTQFAFRIPGDLKYAIAAWVKPSANTFGTILRKKDQYSVARTTNGTVAWAFRTFNNPTLTYVDTGVAIPLNVWSHVVVELDYDVVKTYLNGRLAHEATNIGDVYTWDNMFDPITIGGAQDRPDYFKGVLDELQIFEHGFGAARSEELFLSGPAGACPPKATHFALTTPAPIQATYGSPTYRVELALRDENGLPVAQRQVHLESIVGAQPLSTSTADRVTDANGVVVWDAPLKNAPPGSYPDYLSATFDGDAEYVRAYVEPAVVVNKATPVITWPSPSAITYGTALGSAQLNATANVPGTFNYSPASGTVLGAGAQTLGVTFTPSNTTYYDTTTASASLAVNKAAPTVTVTGGAFTHDGQPHPATGTARGIGGVDLGALTFTYNESTDAPVAPGTYAVVGTFAGNANYDAGSANATITIAKATPSLTWNTPAAIVYGTPLSAAQLNATSSVPGTFTYTPAPGTILNAGPAQTLTAQFTPEDTANYNGASAATTIDVSKAAATVTVIGGTHIYDGQPHPATGTIRGIGDVDLGSPSFTYNGSTNAPVTAGAYDVVGTFAGNENYEAGSATTAIVITKAVPIPNWETPAAIVYGTPLGAAQLNATANVPGTFTYSPPAGTILGAGLAQPLRADFTPTDTTNYHETIAITSIDVTKAGATVSATGGTFTFDAQPHPATCSAAGVGGTALTPLSSTYNGQPGAPVNAGTYAVVCAFAGDANHTAASATATIVIGKATPVVGWNAPAGIVYGTPLGAAQLAATSNVAGSFAYAPAVGTVLPAGNHALGATFTPADSVNYTNASAGTTLTVARAALVVRANDAGKQFGAPLPAFGASFAGFVNGETPANLIGALALGTPATAQSAVGMYPIVPSGLSSPNYSIAFVNGTLTIIKGGVAVSVLSSPTPSGAGQPMTFTAAVSAAAPAVGTPAGAVQFLDGGTPIGSAAISAGIASLTTAGLASGTHTIEARYLGDASFEIGSATASHVVNTSASTPSLTLTSSRNPSSSGQSVTLTANASMSSGAVAGSIQFWDGATLLGTSTIASGRATLTTTSLSVGSHAITARYLGSASAPPANSTVLVQAVGTTGWKNRNTTASVSSSANPSTLGAGVTLTATIVGSSSSAPTGRVLFMMNGSVIGDPAGVPVTFVSGTTVRASLPVANLPRGAHRVTVTYLGNMNYKGSTAALTQTVN